VTSSGKLFQTLAPTIGKTRLPTVGWRKDGTSSYDGGRGDIHFGGVTSTLNCLYSNSFFDIIIVFLHPLLDAATSCPPFPTFLGRRVLAQASHHSPWQISYRPITRTCVYISKVSYFTSFRFPASSIVGLGLGLVVGLGTVLVLFFYCIFSFPMYVKRPKITTNSSASSVA